MANKVALLNKIFIDLGENGIEITSYTISSQVSEVHFF